MATVQDQIAQARAAGYSDAEISEKLASMPEYGDKIKIAAGAGYDPSEIVAHLSGAATTSSKVDPQRSGFFENLGNGIVKGVTDFGIGAKQLLDDTAAAAERRFGGQAINEALGLKNASDIQKETQAVVDRRKVEGAPLMQTTGGKIGSFVGGAVPAVAASFIPGMQGLAGSVATGAGLGAAAPVASDESRAKNAVLGGAGGALGYGAAKAVSSFLKPSASVNAELAALKSEGVEPTVGQTLGGWANTMEQKLQSIPILGDGITAARRRALDQFNNAAVNRATAPIGVQVEGTGQAAIKQAGDALSQAYDDALRQVPHVNLDNQFAADLGQLHGMTQNLVPNLSAKFDKVLKDTVLGRVSPQGSMIGETYKGVDSELGNLAAKWQKSQVASEAEFGDAVAQLKSLLDQNMRRSNPQIADRIASIDEGWANLVRIEQAAKSAHNTEGVFTPAQLASAVRMADNSTRGRAVARGTALMQDLSRAGQNVLGNTVPDSGTAGRLAAGPSGMLAAGFVNPAIPIGAAVGGAAYSAPMQRILNTLITARPAIASPISDAISNQAARAGAMGAAGMLAPPINPQARNPIEDMKRATNVGEMIDAATRLAEPGG